MTFEQALEAARSQGGGWSLDAALAVVRWLADTLGEAQPCGLEPPRAVDGDVIVDQDVSLGMWMTPGDARAFAAMLLRAADLAEEQRKK